MMGILVRMLGGDYPILQIAVLRNLFGVLPALFLLWHARQLSNLAMLLNRQGLLITVIRSASVAIAQFCFYNALTRIEFDTATALAFCGPMFLTALSVPILGHKVGIWRWSAILIGLAGVIIILQPFRDGFVLTRYDTAGNGGLFLRSIQHIGSVIPSRCAIRSHPI